MRYTITVKPGSKREEILPSEAGLLIRTHARAHDGEANQAVIKLLAQYFDVPKTAITVVAGAKSHHKIIEIPD